MNECKRCGGTYTDGHRRCPKCYPNVSTMRLHELMAELYQEIDELRSRMTIGQVNGEDCAFCGEPLTWHPDCLRCEVNRRDVQIHELEAVIGNVADALLNASGLGASRAVNATFRRHSRRLREALGDKDMGNGLGSNYDQRGASAATQVVFLEAKVRELEEQVEGLERELGAQTYMGNSVAYWHQKAKCYGDMVHGINPVLMAREDEMPVDAARRRMGQLEAYHDFATWLRGWNESVDHGWRCEKLRDINCTSDHWCLKCEIEARIKALLEGS